MRGSPCGRRGSGTSYWVWKSCRLAAAAGTGKECSCHPRQNKRPGSRLSASARPGKAWGPGWGYWREEEAPLLTPGVVESGFLQELLKDCNFSGTNFGGNCQMHLALVRDRRGESKNNRGRAATQCECRAGNRIPMAGAGGGDCDEAALYQSRTRVARAPPGSPALGEHPNG